MGDTGKRSTVQASLGKMGDPIRKTTKAKRAGGVAEVVERPECKPQYHQIKTEKAEEEEEEGGKRGGRRETMIRGGRA
jgi:hypothetical protein